MVRIGILVCMLLAWAGSGRAEPEAAVRFRLLKTDPALTSVLARSDGLYVRLAYRSDRPVRFRMTGYADGAEVRAGAMFNAAVLHPAGEGEALVWLAYRQPAQLDHIRITALDANWQPLATDKTAVNISWTSVPGHRQPAGWAERMGREQQETVQRQIEQHEGAAGDAMFALMLVGVLGYFVLQPLTVLWLGGRWRTAALLPLVATVPLLLHAAIALAASANLWPMLLIVCLPVATIYLLALTAAHAVTSAAARGCPPAT